MQALSVANPVGYLVVSGAKDIENRTWSTKFRGRLAIHSSGKLDYFAIDSDVIPEKVAQLYAGQPLPDPPTIEAVLAYADTCDRSAAAVARLYALAAEYYGMPEGMADVEACKAASKRVDWLFLRSGAIIGDVELIDVIEDSESPWAEPGKKHWVLGSPRMYVRPVVNVQGRLRLFGVNVEPPEEYYDLTESVKRKVLS